MPDWKLTDASGRSYSSNDFKGKVTLVEFTFNACGACVLAVPVMKHLHDKYSGSVQIININTIDNRESVSRFATKHAIPFPILINGKAVGKISQVSSYPTIYLIDREGNIFFASKGYNDELEKTLIEQIDKVI
jgi:thiol-disulfide isomerase/thioredoxin